MPLIVQTQSPYPDHVVDFITTPLTGNQSVTGSIVNMAGYSSLVYSISSDQISAVSGIIIQGSSDGVDWSVRQTNELSVYYTGSNKSLDTIIRPRDLYMRVIYTNGAVSQGYFKFTIGVNKNTPAGDVVGVDHVPRRGDSAQIVKSVIAGMTPDRMEYQDVHVSRVGGLHASIEDYRETEFGIQISPAGDVMTQSPIRMVGSDFIGNVIDSVFWSTGSVNGGTVQITSSIVHLRTGTSVSGSASLQSARAGRSQFAYTNKFRATCRIPDTGTVGNIRRGGVDNGTDGFGFVMSGTNFGVYWNYSGTVTNYFSSSLNGLASAYLNNDTNAHTYEIVYWTAGAYYFFDNIFVHSIIPTTHPIATNLNLPVRVTSVNSGSLTSDIDVEVWNATIIRQGNMSSIPTWSHLSGAFTSTLKLGPCALHRVIFNKIGAVGDTFAIYDSTGSLTNQVASSNFGANQIGGIYPAVVQYDVVFQNGLTVTAAGTSDYTVVFD
jgi:hypothetical protein